MLVVAAASTAVVTATGAWVTVAVLVDVGIVSGTHYGQQSQQQSSVLLTMAKSVLGQRAHQIVHDVST